MSGHGVRTTGAKRGVRDQLFQHAVARQGGARVPDAGARRSRGRRVLEYGRSGAVRSRSESEQLPGQRVDRSAHQRQNRPGTGWKPQVGVRLLRGGHGRPVAGRSRRWRSRHQRRADDVPGNRIHHRSLVQHRPAGGNQREATVRWAPARGDRQTPAPGSTGNIAFTLAGYDDAHLVTVYGDFNGWQPWQHRLGRVNGRWAGRVELPPGRHRYRFFVDGRELVDPANTEREIVPGLLLQESSVITVKAP
jgi:hypothetical protein